jgi:hypothetical protein
MPGWWILIHGSLAIYNTNIRKNEISTNKFSEQIGFSFLAHVKLVQQKAN